LARDARFATSYSPIIKQVAPSVVNIYSTKTVREMPRFSPFLDDPFLRRFFGGEPDDGRSGRRPRTREEQSLGSGVILSEDGYILTNNHVVDDADEIKVALTNGKVYDAKPVGADPQTDVAVLKVDATGLPAMTLADSDNLEVGDVVIAIGNPFGLGQTVTMGIVSATGRGGFGLVDYEDFIQTDASINPGNSGGALVDARGRLVGLNTFIISRSGGSQGVGFAVPINLARNVLERLVKDGKVTRGLLGVYVQPVTPELAEEFKLPKDQQGALIGGVTSRGPAAAAGLKPGDVVIEYNGKKVNDSRHFRLMVAQTAPDTKVAIKVLHAGKEKEVTAVLEELTPEQSRVSSEPRRRSSRSESQYETLDGVEVADLDARTRRQLDVPADVRGALVSNVDPESSAARAGLQVGDVILEINHAPVRNADAAVTLSENNKSSRILLQVWTKGASHYLVVERPKRAR
jgi:serine protease Do